MNAVVPVEAPTAPAPFIRPSSFGELVKYAEYIASSDLVPKDFQHKPANVALAMQWATELGVSPLQGLTSIAVINGRPSVWGDLAMALARSHPACELIDEQFEHGDDGQVIAAVCRVKRRGSPEQVRRFSIADARAAGLLDKPGPWKQYRSRMLQMRARAFAIRDVFPDALRGLAVAEEMQDVEATVVQTVPAGAARTSTPAGPQRKPRATEPPAEPSAPAEPTHPEAASPADEQLGQFEAEAEAEPAQACEHPETGAASVVLPDAKARILRATLDRAGKTEADLLAGFGGVNEANLNDALRWVRS